ncbi:uncharacterized protein PF11_0207-like [Xiphophorus hellerii]|uniref:uncharacterized protein PF11_0207-like n=1 Tax=Xiphophorus hellerii TaxID=8084 RepID=UPI0013B38B58|nr:uncharacterized protein PF11_0207-like [Xiphophorus hellerii]
MSGGRKQRSIRKKMAEVYNPDAEEMEEESGDSSQLQAVLEGLHNITAEIRDFKKEGKENLTQFKDEFKEEVKREFMGFKEEIKKKVAQNDAEIQKQQEDMTEAQGRIAELEESNTEAKAAILNLLKQQRKLQEKLTELEGHGRRCNMRIYNVAEQEGELVQERVEKLLHRELALPAGTELQIQRAHRSFGKRPPPEANPRSIVVNFLKYKTKEEILTKAWKKKIQVEGKRIFFDHDYPTEVIEKRKSYSKIKKALKDRKIRFQTPMTKIRIHWSDGIKIYNNAEEAAIDMRRRGLEMENQNDTGPSPEERSQTAASWQEDKFVVKWEKWSDYRRRPNATLVSS